MRKKLIMVSLFFILLFVLNGCINDRSTPPLGMFKEYGNSVEISSASLYMDQAFDMLNAFNITNNYSSIEDSIVVVYIIKSDELDKYYEIYYPIKNDYDVIVRETIIPEFSIIQSEIENYLQKNNGLSIELYSEYDDMFFFPNIYNKDFSSRIPGLEDLVSPIILKVGKIELESTFPTISLAKYSDNRFILFYSNLSGDITIISDFGL